MSLIRVAFISKEEYIHYENTGGGRLPCARDPSLSFQAAAVRAGPGRREKIPWTGYGAKGRATKGILQTKAFEILY